MTRFWIFIFFAATLGCSAQQAGVQHSEPTSINDLDIFSRVQPIPAQNIFADSAYNIWCGAMVKGENGKYYMFYSRWPRKSGHYAWVTESEIALAKSDKPGGPYRHVKVVLPARERQFWDGACTHNPAIIFHGGKYYLYYMGTTGDNIEFKKVVTMSDATWWEFRNNQRIGLATADDPEGEWKRMDQPLINVSQDATAFDGMLVNNPAVAVTSGDSVTMVYKSVEKNASLRGGKVHFGLAKAASPAGPFVKYQDPIFEFKSDSTKDVWMLAEDPFLWVHENVYYTIVRDVEGVFTNKEATLAMLRSADGIHWQPAKHPRVAPHRLKFEDGTMSDDRIERPWLYFDNGVPVLLFGALGVDNRTYSVNVAVPLMSGK